VDRGDLLYVVLPFVVLGAMSIGFALMMRRRWRMDRAAMRHAARLVEPDIVTPPRDATPAAYPRWANPWLWVSVSAAFVVLGVLVWPAFFGGVFLFIPFMWISRSKPPTMDPRSNGHAKREGPV
jgi:hypothetical protein